MLTRNQLAKIAQRNHVGLGVQERDYVQYMFLSLLFAKTQHLVFKGGTALRVAYGFARYSEDLDFNSQLPSDAVNKIIFDIVKIFKENGERAVSGDISYEGPLFTGEAASKGKVRVDVSLRGEETETKRVDE